MDKTDNHQNSPPFLSDQKKHHILPIADQQPINDSALQISVNM